MNPWLYRNDKTDPKESEQPHDGFALHLIVAFGSKPQLPYSSYLQFMNMGLSPNYNVPIPGTHQASHTMSANARLSHNDSMEINLNRLGTPAEAAIVWI
ncbi:hypothetical protein MLD52_18955 [Puniceicoccaceae bacterium K14]|nr:hypothetical protein [Puniceicoccaceae bacterium K14]